MLAHLAIWALRTFRLEVVVEPTPEQARIYPFHGRTRREVIVLLDDDPLIPPERRKLYPLWSCALDRKDVRMLP